MGRPPETLPSRRAFVRGALAVGGMLIAPGCTRRAAEVATRPLPAPPFVAPPVVATRPEVKIPVRAALLDRAKAALDTHGGRIARRDRIALADFAAPSSQTRFHLVDLESGRTKVLLVAHGSGSDPGHTGFLQSFSNDDGSNASCEGAFLTSDYYVGQHGRSQRLVGLDPTNSNALPRAIVVHGAWYAERAVIAEHGKLGRSQGCFAVGDSDLQTVFDLLGEGRMIYAAKV